MATQTFTTLRLVFPLCPHKHSLTCGEFILLQGNFILSRRPHLIRRIQFSFHYVISLGWAEKLFRRWHQVSFVVNIKEFTFETTLVFNCTLTLIQEQTHLSFHDKLCTCKGCDIGDPTVKSTRDPSQLLPNQVADCPTSCCHSSIIWYCSCILSTSYT